MAKLLGGDPLPAPELHPAAVAVLSLAGVDATPEDQQALCYRAIEKLRLWHNEQGDRTRLKPDDPQAMTLAEFREWVRKEWEPRHKAAYLALHSTAGFDQKAPADIFSTDPLKQAAAQQVEDAKQAAKTVASASRTFDSAIGAVDKFPSLAAAEAVEDPLEDYTTYTEVDPASHITITSSSKINWADLTRGETADVYKDKGVGHFAANFTHLLETYLSSTGLTGALSIFWGISNALGNSILVNPSLWAYWYQGNTTYKTLACNEGGLTFANTGTLSLSTLYYDKIVRDEAVGTYGTLYLYVYSDAARTTLVTSCSLALAAKNDYRYSHALSSYNDSQSQMKTTGYVQNLDIGEAMPWLYARRQAQVIGGGFG